MKALSKYMLLSLGLAQLWLAGCTLSTTGLRPPSDHSLAYGAITEVYDKPKVVKAPAAPAPACTPPSLAGNTADLSGCKAGDKLVITGLNFAVGKATISPLGSQLLDQVVKALTAASAISITIAGHTDNMGDADYNMALSQMRAKSVMDYLVGKGIAASRMSMKGYGETAPVADNISDEGRFLNRRVELIVGGEATMSTAPVASPAPSLASVETAGASPAPAGIQAMPKAAAPAVTSSEAAQVAIVDHAYEPETLMIEAGTTVTWTNNGGASHTVVFADGKSPRLRAGATFSKTFSSAGEYSYECSIHGSRMSGTVVVSS